MQAEDKLEEARYFLDKLRNLEENLIEFKYNLSAFVSSWRSVLDVLLYDYAEKYFKIVREEQVKITPEVFSIGASAFNVPDAKKFIEWYYEKMRKLRDNRLWKLRIFFVHKGSTLPKDYVKWELIVPLESSCSLSMHIEGVERILVFKGDKMPTLFAGRLSQEEMLKLCMQGFDSMTKIVTEAKATFK